MRALAVVVITIMPLVLGPAAGGTNTRAGSSHADAGTRSSGTSTRAQTSTRIELIAFNQRIEDAIQFDLAGFSGYLQDVGTSYSDGIELVLEQSLSAQWQFNANFTWNDTAQPDGSQRLRRPKQLG